MSLPATVKSGQGSAHTKNMQRAFGAPMITTPPVAESTMGTTMADQIKTMEPGGISPQQSGIQENEEVRRRREDFPEPPRDELGKATPLPEGVDPSKYDQGPAMGGSGPYPIYSDIREINGGYEEGGESMGVVEYDNGNSYWIHRTPDSYVHINLTTGSTVTIDGSTTTRRPGEQSGSKGYDGYTIREDKYTGGTIVNYSSGGTRYTAYKNDDGSYTLYNADTGEVVYEQEPSDKEPSPEERGEQAGEGQDVPDNQLRALREQFQAAMEEGRSGRGGQTSPHSPQGGEGESQRDVWERRADGRLVPKDDDRPDEMGAASTIEGLDQGAVHQAETHHPGIGDDGDGGGDPGPIGPNYMESGAQAAMSAAGSSGSAASPPVDGDGDDDPVPPGPEFLESEHKP